MSDSSSEPPALPAAAVALLRRNYDPRAVVGAAQAAARLCPPAAGLLDFINHQFYSQAPRIAAPDRERVILALFTAQGAHPLHLAIHIYVALMEGLAAEEIADVMLLAGVYAGVSRFTSALAVAARVFALLGQAGAGVDEEARTEAVFQRLGGAFGVIPIGDIAKLACPACRSALAHRGEVRDGRIWSGTLACARCRAEWPVHRGIGRLYRESEVAGNDRLMRYIYDHLAPLHDPVVDTAFWMFQLGTAAAMREAYMRRVELGRLAPREGGEPVRILEVGVGGGANLELVRRDLPPGVAAELWGVDLSAGMLATCRRRLERRGDRETRILLADAHALPFPDRSFDRVFHIGAIGNYRDPKRALAEMARVAVRGSPIVVVDEQLDRRAPQSLYHRAGFRLVTFYEPRPHCPVEHLPPGATGVVAEQPNRFFYCLTFRMAT